MINYSDFKHKQKQGIKMKKVYLTITILLLVVIKSLFAQNDTTYLKNLYIGLGHFGELDTRGQYTYVSDPRIGAEVIAERSGFKLFSGVAWSTIEKSAELYLSRKIVRGLEFAAGPWIPRYNSRIKPSSFRYEAHVPLDGERIITGPGVGSQLNYIDSSYQFGVGLYTFQSKPEYDGGFSLSTGNLKIKYGFLYRLCNNDKQHTGLIEFGNLHISYNHSSFNKLNSFGLAYSVFSVTPYWDYLDCPDETLNSREFGVLTGPYQVKNVPVIMNLTVGYNYKQEKAKFLLQIYYDF